MAIRLLATGEKAAAVKFRRALSRAVDTTMAPRKNTWGAKKCSSRVARARSAAPVEAGLSSR